MKNLRNKNHPPNADLVQVYLESSWDKVVAVYAELDDIQTVADAINGGDLGNYLTAEDIDTIAELNAILTDATLGRFSTQGEAEGGSDNTTTMTPLRVAQAIASQVTTLQHNYTGTAPPTITDDSNAGYGAGSIWFDTTADPDETYRCTDPSVGAAVWIKTSLTSDELATVAISGDSDDLIEGATNLLLTAVERSRLAGMEDNATADQTDSEIKTAYENLTTLVSQVEAEAGTSTTIRTWTAERVKQAIVALGGGNGLSGDYINTNTNALAGTHYQVDTTGGAVTLTLPASPVDGDYISFADAGGQAGTNFITVGRNGNTIDGAAADGAMLSSGMFQVYIWDGANTDWKTWSLTPHPDPGGGGGGLTVEFKTASFTAVAGKKYKVDTSGGAVTVTLPAGTNLDNIVIQDVGHVAGTNNITVNPNGVETIDGDTTFVIDQNDGDIDIGYNSGTTDWEVSSDGTPDLVNVDDYVAGTQSIFIRPYDLSQVSGETTRVQVTNAGTAIDAVNFPASAGYHWATWAFTPEARWALNSNFRFRVFWFPSNTDTGNVQFGMYNGATLADGEDLGTSWDVGNGVAIEDEAQGLANRLSVSAWTAWNSMNLSFARDNLTLLRFQRNKNEAGDTHTGDMRVVLIEIQWISDASNND